MTTSINRVLSSRIALKLYYSSYVVILCYIVQPNHRIYVRYNYQQL